MRVIPMKIKAGKSIGQRVDVIPPRSKTVAKKLASKRNRRAAKNI